MYNILPFLRYTENPDNGLYFKCLWARKFFSYLCLGSPVLGGGGERYLPNPPEQIFSEHRRLLCQEGRKEFSIHNLSSTHILYLSRRVQDNFIQVAVSTSCYSPWISTIITKFIWDYPHFQKNVK